MHFAEVREACCGFNKSEKLMFYILHPVYLYWFLQWRLERFRPWCGQHPLVIIFADRRFSQHESADLGTPPSAGETHPAQTPTCPKKSTDYSFRKQDILDFSSWAGWNTCFMFRDVLNHTSIVSVFWLASVRGHFLFLNENSLDLLRLISLQTLCIQFYSDQVSDETRSENADEH